MSRFKLCLLFGILTLLPTLSSTTHQNNGTTKRNGERARTREQLQTEYERMTFRRCASTSRRSSLSSLLSMTRSLLVNSSSSQSTMSPVVTHDTYHRRRHEHDDQFHFDFIASQASPTQVTLHPFQHSSNVFLQNFTFVNENLQIQLDYQSMTPVDEIDNFPIKDCFALLDHGVLHTKLYIGILYEKGKFLFYYFWNKYYLRCALIQAIVLVNGYLFPNIKLIHFINESLNENNSTSTMLLLTVVPFSALLGNACLFYDIDSILSKHESKRDALLSQSSNSIDRRLLMGRWPCH